MEDFHKGVLELTHIMVGAVVDHSDFEVFIDQGENTTVVNIRPNKLDIGQLLGKQGKMIDAIRQILNNHGCRHSKRVIVLMVEDANA